MFLCVDTGSGFAMAGRRDRVQGSHLWLLASGSTSRSSKGARGKQQHGALATTECAKHALKASLSSAVSVPRIAAAVANDLIFRRPRKGCRPTATLE